jgi:hypothetical protein
MVRCAVLGRKLSCYCRNMPSSIINNSFAFIGFINYITFSVVGFFLYRLFCTSVRRFVLYIHDTSKYSNNICTRANYVRPESTYLPCLRSLITKHKVTAHSIIMYSKKHNHNLHLPSQLTQIPVFYKFLCQKFRHKNLRNRECEIYILKFLN